MSPFPLPLRKLLVSVQTGTLFPGSGFCFDLDPGPSSGAPLVSACDDSRGVGLILAANLWPGVQYVLRFTSAPDAYAVPAQQLVGPFDDTTELNRVDALSGPAGSVHVNVTWQGGRSSAPFDFNGVCASLSPGGPTVPVFPPEGCLRDDGTMSFDHTPVGDYQVLFGRTFVNFLSQYVMPGPAQVSVTQGATASVDIQIPTRKLLVTVHPQGALFPGPGFCYDMIPDLPHADQLTASACDDSFGLGLIGVDHLWGGVPYTLHFTSAPAAYALPPDQIVGPFDDTTEVNHVDVNAGPAGQARFSVLFENGPPEPNTGSACFYLTGPGVVSAVQCTDHDGDLFFDQLPFGTYTTHIATGGPASQPNQVPQGYVVPDSIQVGASDVRQAPQTVVVHKRRLEVHAGSPATGPQPGLCYSFLIRLSLLGDLPIADFCDVDDGASDGIATFGASSTQLVSNDTTYVLHVHSNPVVPASEMEKVFGPFDQTTNPQVVNVTTADNHAPIAVDDNLDAVSGTDTVVRVLANDSEPDGDTLALASVSTPQHGTATIQDDTVVINGIVILPFGIRLHYISDPTYSGPDSFTYTIRDSHGKTATATVAVTVVDGARIFVSGADIVCVQPESPSANVVLSGCQNTPVTRSIPPQGLRLQVTRAFMRTGSTIVPTISEVLPPAPATVVPSPGLHDLTLFVGGPAGWVHITSVDATTNAAGRARLLRGATERRHSGRAMHLGPAGRVLPGADPGWSHRGGRDLGAPAARPGPTGHRRRSAEHRQLVHRQRDR